MPSIFRSRGAGAPGDGSPGRLVFLSLESPARRALVLAAAVAVVLWLARAAVSPAVAAYLAGTAAGVEDLERAVAWDPENPDLHLRLARAYATAIEGSDLAKARLHAETALRLRPTDASTWLQLALLADREGKREEARWLLAAALRLDPHSVSLRWEAALLALRWGDRDEALEHFRYVLEVDSRRRDAAFQLARSLLAPGESQASLLPSQPEALDALLAFAVRDGDVELAEAAWERRLPLAPPSRVELQRRYLDLLLEKGEGAAARAAWLAMRPGGNPAPDGNVVWNGGFETDRLLGWGLDWQVSRVWGVEVRLDRSTAARGSRSLRLVFNSFPTLDFAGVFQLVPVEPGRHYRLTALAKADDFVTRSGLKLQVVTRDGDEVLAETEAIAGTTADWVPLEATLRVPPGTSLIRLRLRREKAPAPEGNLGGRVWIDEVSLAPLPGRAA